MLKLFEMGTYKDTISLIIDLMNFFHYPFRRILPADSFRYLICGGGNTLLDAFLFFVFYNYVFNKEAVDLTIITITPYIASFILVFPITFFTSFLLTKFIVFNDSLLKWRIQLLRFGVTIASSFILHYLVLKFFIELLNVYPTPSKLLTSLIVAFFSYLSHRYFSFNIYSLSLNKRLNK